MSATRIKELEMMLQARTDSEGNAWLGFKRNVAAINAEIRRLTAAMNPVEPGAG